MTKRTSPTNTATSTMYLPYHQILLFGDSITQFAASQTAGFAFEPALQDAYMRRVDVLNRGLSGYTSANGLAILPKVFPPPQKARVRLMTVFFGANDAVLPGEEQHVPLDKYKKYLKGIVKHPLVQAQKTKVLLLTPPPVNEYQMQWLVAPKGYMALQRAANNTKKYADACREEGEAIRVPVVDIWSAFMKEAGWTEGNPLAGSKDAPENKRLATLLSDGLHFTPAGYRIMYDEVMKAIKKHYPEEAPEKLPEIFPPFDSAPWPDKRRSEQG